MNLIRAEVAWTVIAGALPVLIGSFLASKTRSNTLLILLRVVYLPWFMILCLPFYWFWAGDGTINLLTVPPIFLVFSFLTVRYGRSASAKLVRIKDWYFFSFALGGFLTFWAVVLIHVILARPLLIA